MLVLKHCLRHWFLFNVGSSRFFLIRIFFNQMPEIMHVIAMALFWLLMLLNFFYTCHTEMA